VNPKAWLSSAYVSERHRMFSRLGLILFGLAVAGLAAPYAARAEDDSRDAHWVGTWSASPQAPNLVGIPILPAGFTNQTLREIVHTSIGGKVVRARLTNAYGTAPLSIGAAHLAIRSTGAAIVPGSDRPLTFSGGSSVTIPPGALAVSDPVFLDVPAMGDLAVSIYVPGPTGPPTNHFFSMQTNYVSPPGNFVAAADMPVASTETCISAFGFTFCSSPWLFLAGVEVMASKQTSAVVTFGDSITDGAASTVDANRRWPDDLARRLLARKGNRDVGVLNQGIGGNGLLSTILGESAQTRLDRDVLVQSGAKWVILLEGINDSQSAFVGDRLIAADLQIIERAHALGLKIYGATLTPAGSTGNRELSRATLNQWIRTSGAFDAVIDFDAVTRDPSNPTFFLPIYDSGDHLHPNDAGYQAMANAIDLSLFRGHDGE